QPLAGQPALLVEHSLPVIEGRKQRVDGLVVGGLRSGESGLVDAVVDRLVDRVDDPLDLAAQLGRGQIELALGDAGELVIEHPDDLPRLVVDDRAELFVPQDRHGHAAGVAGIGADVDLSQVTSAEQPVLARAGHRGVEAPALVTHEVVDHRDVDGLLEALQRTHDQRAVRPWARQRDIQVIAVGDCRMSTLGADPTVKAGRVPHEAALGVGLVPLGRPLAVDEASHVSGPTAARQNRYNSGSRGRGTTPLLPTAGTGQRRRPSGVAVTNRNCSSGRSKTKRIVFGWPGAATARISTRKLGYASTSPTASG